MAGSGSVGPQSKDPPGTPLPSPLGWGGEAYGPFGGPFEAPLGDTAFLRSCWAGWGGWGAGVGVTSADMLLPRGVMSIIAAGAMANEQSRSAGASCGKTQGLLTLNGRSVCGFTREEELAKLEKAKVHSQAGAVATSSVALARLSVFCSSCVHASLCVSKLLRCTAGGDQPWQRCPLRWQSLFTASATTFHHIVALERTAGGSSDTKSSLWYSRQGRRHSRQGSS